MRDKDKHISNRIKCYREHHKRFGEYTKDKVLKGYVASRKASLSGIHLN